MKKKDITDSKLLRFAKGELTYSQTKKLNREVFEREHLRQRIMILIQKLPDGARSESETILRELREYELLFRAALWGESERPQETFERMMETSVSDRQVNTARERMSPGDVEDLLRGAVDRPFRQVREALHAVGRTWTEVTDPTEMMFTEMKALLKATWKARMAITPNTPDVNISEGELEIIMQLAKDLPIPENALSTNDSWRQWLEVSFPLAREIVHTSGRIANVSDEEIGRLLTHTGDWVVIREQTYGKKRR